MKTNYFQWMLAIYLTLGALMGVGFSLLLNLVIPIPQDLFQLFLIASVLAGLLLGSINYFVYRLFTRMFIRHFNRVLGAVRSGDLSARSEFHTGGIVGELNANINKTLANLERSQNSVIHDDLTGIPNRYALQQFFLNKEGHGRYVLLFIDVNDFKEINDTFGHVAGDETLRYIARILQETVSDGGQVYRLSGDEFIVVNDWRGEDALESVYHRIHQAFAVPFRNEDDLITISVSIGSHPFRFGEKDLIEILDEADQDMYRMKNERILRIESEKVNPC